MKLQDYAFLRLLGKSLDKPTAKKLWGNIVRSYSRCNLTFWKDRWAAFQGLASEVSQAQDWEPVHGLRHNLIGVDELLWQTELPGSGTIECGEPS